MSSRVCVKNLPRKCTETRLREHFAAHGGDITDLRIMRKADGSSRMFGFVGYKTEKMAAAACSYFNNTFIGTVRISVELARTRGDEQLARPWSKHSKGSSAFERVQARTLDKSEANVGTKADGEAHKAGRGGSRAEDDPKLREFLALMRPKGSAGKFWAADGDVVEGEAPGAEAVAGGKPSARRPLKAVTKQLEVPNRKPGGEGQVVIKTHVTFEEDEDVAAESDDEYQPIMAGVGGLGTDGLGGSAAQAAAAAKAQGMSDLDYLRSRQKAASLSDDEDEEQEEGEGEASDGEAGSEAEEGEEGAAEAPEAADDGPAEEQARSDAAAEAESAAAQADDADLAETGRLFVRNLSYDVTDAELKHAFSKFGPLADVLVPTDATTKRGKGFAYVQYMLPEHAVRALAKLDGSIFQGRIIHLLPARLPPSATRRDGGEGEGAAGFKATKEAQRRADAQVPTGWNSLFMGADAVAAAAAEGLGLSKAQLLGPDADDAAVRLALGETSIVAATKAWFRTHGLNARALDALDAAREAAASAGRPDIARSRTVFLVKNLPVGATEAMLHAQFGRYGTIARLLLPPARTLALVEYAAIPEARRAFAGMAYRKLGEGHAPLYLEWAPQALLEEEEEAADAADAAKTGARAGDGADEEEEEEEEEDTESDGESRRRGDARAARAEEQPAGATKAARAAAAPEHGTAVGATAAVPGARGTMCGGADGEGEDEDEEGLAGSGCSVYVKNLSFLTDEPKLRSLFEKRFPQCALKSVVIAKKPDRKQPGKFLSMGYGFVEFATPEHAKEVVKTMAASARPLTLDKHALSLKLSTHSTGASAAVRGARGAAVERRAPAPKGKPSRKLTVRNVPFEASKKELRQLFASFGELQSVRLPKKFDGKHRGFAFVEYLSKADASKAMEALGNTHLYGRHLVLEWAAEEQSLDALRDKAKRNLDASQKAADAKRLRAADGPDDGFDRDADAGLEDQMLVY